MAESIKTRDMVEKILECFRRKSERNYMIAKVQLNTAIKTTQLINLKASHFIKKDGSIKRYLEIDDKKIGINNTLAKSMLEYIDYYNIWYDDYLFESRKGLKKQVEQKQVIRIFSQVAKELELENFSPESLRKTWGYHTYVETGDILLVMEVLERADLSETFNYIGIRNRTGNFSNRTQNIFFNIEF